MQNQLMVTKLLFKEKEQEINEEYIAEIEEVIDYCQSKTSTRLC